MSHDSNNTNNHNYTTYNIDEYEEYNNNNEYEEYESIQKSFVQLLEQAPWIQLSSSSSSSSSTVTNQHNDKENDDDEIKLQHVQQQQLKIIQMIQMNSNILIQYMEQSNDKNQHWDYIIQFIQSFDVLYNNNCKDDNSDNHYIKITNNTNAENNDGDRHHKDTPTTSVSTSSGSFISSLSSYDIFLQLMNIIIVKCHGWNLLHWLCSNGGTPINVLQVIIQQLQQYDHHNNMNTRNNHDTTTYMKQSTNDNQRSSLVYKYLTLPDTYIGDTCIHLLCRTSCQFSSTKLQLILQSLSVLSSRSSISIISSSTGIRSSIHDDTIYNDNDCLKEVIMIRNKVGTTILHAAIIGNAIYDVIYSIIQCNPNIVTIRGYDHNTHVLNALWYSYIETIPGLLSINDILRRNRTGKNTLLLYENSLLFQQFWKKVELIALHQFLLSNTCPIKIKNLDEKHTLLFHDNNHKYNDNKITPTNNNHNIQNDNDENDTIQNETQEKEDEKYILHNYVLHGLLQCTVPKNMIVICLILYPKMTMIHDINGNLPLHILLYNHQFYCSSTTTNNDNNTRTNRYNKHNNHNQEEYDIIEKCIMTYPNAVFKQNHQQLIPLQIAIMNKIPIYTKGTTTTKIETSTLIMDKKNYTNNIYELLIKAGPDTIQYRTIIDIDNNNINQHRKTNDTITNNNKDDRNDTDNDTMIDEYKAIIGLYPYQLAAMNDNCSTSIQSIERIYYLLRLQPNLLL